MQLSHFLKDSGLDDEAFAALSNGLFSASAVKKWRYGERVPRPAHMRLIAEVTGGRVTANDFHDGIPTDDEHHQGAAA